MGWLLLIAQSIISINAFAIVLALVGDPIWSLTILISSLAFAKFKIVLTLFEALNASFSETGILNSSFVFGFLPSLAGLLCK